MLSRSLFDCQSSTLKVMIQFSQFVSNSQLCHQVNNSLSMSLYVVCTSLSLCLSTIFNVVVFFCPCMCARLFLCLRLCLLVGHTIPPALLMSCQRGHTCLRQLCIALKTIKMSLKDSLTHSVTKSPIELS